MRRMPWAVYFWPGLPQLTRHGSWAALFFAVGAAALLNVTLLGSFVWSELFADELRTAFWLMVGLVWSVSAGVSVWRQPRAEPVEENIPGDPFIEAQGFYLQGNWFETERLLVEMLRRKDRDIEARLMLAALLRRTGRLDEATGQLNVLARMDEAAPWKVEIASEGELIAEARKNTITDESLAHAQNGER